MQFRGGNGREDIKRLSFALALKNLHFYASRSKTTRASFTYPQMRVSLCVYRQVVTYMYYILYYKIDSLYLRRVLRNYNRLAWIKRLMIYFGHLIILWYDISVWNHYIQFVIPFADKYDLSTLILKSCKKLNLPLNIRILQIILINMILIIINTKYMEMQDLNYNKHFVWLIFCHYFLL